MQYPTPRMPSNMSSHFTSLPRISRPRSTFIAPLEVHTVHNHEYIYPVFRFEVLPGDTIQFDGRLLSRLITPLVPFMSNLYLDLHVFYSPSRLDWENWDRFLGERRPDTDTTIDLILPQIYLPATTGWEEDSLQDYLNYGCPGVAGDGTSTYSVHNLYGRMYNNVWNLFYRDQNYQDSVPHDIDDGPDSVSDYVLLKRNKRLDYFSGILPEPQKGTAQVLFTSGTAPVYGNTLTGGVDGGYGHGAAVWQGVNVTEGDFNTKYYGSLGASTTSSPFEIDAVANAASGTQTTDEWDQNGYAIKGLTLGTPQQYTELNAGTSSTSDSRQYAPPYADLSAALSNTINEFRLAATVQQYLELDMRGGTRLVEIILSHWGVAVPDFRIQRPELIGSASFILNMQTVPNMTDPQSELGELGAFGVFNGKIKFSKSFVEHGRILGLISVRSDLSYQRGVDRELSRRTRFDFYDPLFANIGEQAVLNKELTLQGLAGGNADDAVIGYQEAWAEYRYLNSMITAAMRSTHSETLDIWHLAQELEVDAVIDNEFIVDSPPIARVTGYEDYFFKTNIFANVKMTRMMPTYSVPGLLRI